MMDQFLTMPSSQMSPRARLLGPLGAKPQGYGASTMAPYAGPVPMMPGVTSSGGDNRAPVYASGGDNAAPVTSSGGNNLAPPRMRPMLGPLDRMVDGDLARRTQVGMPGMVPMRGLLR